MQALRMVLFSLVLSAVVHCGNTDIYDQAAVTYYRVVRNGLNEWYPMDGNLSSRIGSAAGIASGAYTAGTNRAGEAGKANCTTASSFTFSNSTIGLNPFTESFWIKFNVLPAGANSIFEKGATCTTYNGLRLQQSSTTLQWDHGNCGASAGFVSGTALSANTWIYIAISYGSSTGRLYAGSYGGTLATIGTTSGQPYAQHINPLQIFAGANIDACIDDMLSYNRALTADEINYNFQSLE